MVKRLLAALSLLAVVGLSDNGYASDREGLQVELTPYVWAAGVDGSATIGQQKVHFDQSFSDIVDNIDSAFMVLGVLSYNRWVLYADYDYISMSEDDRAPNGDKLEADLDTDIATIAGGYRFDTFGERNTIDVLVGSRTLGNDLTIKRTGIQTLKLSDDGDVTDTIVMLRPSFQLSEKWRLNPTFSFAVSGDSDEMYELSPQVQYDFSKSFALRFGYRTLHYKLEDGSKNTPNFRELDFDFAGFMIGVGWTFPTQKEEQMAAAPAPAPVAKAAPGVVAAAPRDSDGDGVPDTADACPDTPKGTKVGPKGCPCDMSVQLQYKFDSAELTDQDKKTLDQVAVRLKELNWVGGEAAGYADNVGAADYNVKLSQRRAQSAVDYLVTKGIAKDRITVEGFGSAHPIADNSTAEGRAQNRRVVLRRTDCGKLEQ